MSRAPTLAVTRSDERLPTEAELIDVPPVLQFHGKCLSCGKPINAARKAALYMRRVRFVQGRPVFGRALALCRHPRCRDAMSLLSSSVARLVGTFEPRLSAALDDAEELT